jgi:catechol 2,3-dioxygenase-like lactoylglutathione lyase family enzyme
MSDRPWMQLSGPVLDAPDIAALAEFYHRLLGWPYRKREDDWISLEQPESGALLSFQTEPTYVRPVWPSTATHQQMQLHLDIEVKDLAAAGDYARSLGATLAEFQPQEDVRVYLDPAGHPFCFWVQSAE